MSKKIKKAWVKKSIKNNMKKNKKRLWENIDNLEINRLW